MSEKGETIFLLPCVYTSTTAPLRAPLHRSGDGVVVAFQHLFQVALVDGGRFNHFFARGPSRVMAAAKTAGKPFDLTKSKRSMIGIKAG